MNLKFRLPFRPDFQEVVATSLKRKCPFCDGNLEAMTPRFTPQFIPEGRLHVGEAVVFPNAMPYDQNNAITIFSKKHFIGLSEFSQELMANGFLASQLFLKRVYKANAKNKYFSINWNYMPPSGASLIHPHMHLMADKEPADYHKLMLKRGKRFRKKFNVNYWKDLIREEKNRGERFLGETGMVSWLLNFAPMGMMGDIIGVFEESLSLLDIPAERFWDLAGGLQKIFKYLDSSNIYSFNLTFFSGLREKDYFWNHVRLIPRFTIPPVDTSDVGFPFLLHDESLSIVKPEDICTELQPFLAS
ncbi:MAG: hypothetical protein JXD19_00445 [Deltaproteobacteria bacterium]|nr:hypothetical protein [Deltaproteobacteria bacterium]